MMLAISDRRWSGAAASRCGGRSPTRSAWHRRRRFRRRQLPPETALAARFGVNRHTVRGAIAALVQEGVLRAEQGRGTFVERAQAASPIRSARERASRRAARARRGSGAACCLATAIEPADERVAEALRARRRAPMSCGWRRSARPTAGRCRGRRATSTPRRFAGIEKAYAESGSITAAFGNSASPTISGVRRWFRHAMRCRRPRRSQPVAGRHRAGHGRRQCRPRRPPMQFSETRFAASRRVFGFRTIVTPN